MAAEAESKFAIHAAAREGKSKSGAKEAEFIKASC